MQRCMMDNSGHTTLNNHEMRLFMKKQNFLLLNLFLAFAFVGLDHTCKASDIEVRYEGALKTFYNYWGILNLNELSEKEMGGLFSEQFCFVGNPTIAFSNIGDTTAFYNSVRNEIYPAISSPYEFQSLKIYKMAYQPVSDDSVLLSLIDVFHTTPNQTPRKTMCFTYNLVFNKEKGKWLMNSLINFSVDSFPSNWRPIDVAERWAYRNGPPIEELQSIMAADVVP